MQEMLIPASKVGLVIGRGGDTIKQLQVRTSSGLLTWKHDFVLISCVSSCSAALNQNTEEMLFLTSEQLLNGWFYEWRLVKSLIHGATSRAPPPLPLIGVVVVVAQERAGVKMMMIQDGPMPTGADKPLRISGDPYKVQVRVRGHTSCVGVHSLITSGPCSQLTSSLCRRRGSWCWR